MTRMKHKTCWQEGTGEFDMITLVQTGIDQFTVFYGKQTKDKLTYDRACGELGAAIMHKAACEGKLDNRMTDIIKPPDTRLEFSNVGYEGSKFGNFYVAQDGGTGPGWYIFGRNAHKYEGRYVMLCGYSHEGRARHYNGTRKHGWRTKHQTIAMLANILMLNPDLNKDGQ